MQNYLKEIQVEGKKTTEFNFKRGHYDKYVDQVMRTGNCITLLSLDFPITEESFWNTNYFEDLTQYVFWTFNKSFRLKLIEGIDLLKLSILKRCIELLHENFSPYTTPLSDNADGELQMSYLKNTSLRTHTEFGQMFLLDLQNRKAVLLALEKRIAEFPEPIANPLLLEKPDSPLSVEPDPPITAKKVIFLEVLRPMNGSPEETLQFILQKVEEAGLDHKVTTQVTRLPNGKNPYGFNGAIGAVIDHFYQLNYFKKEYSLEEIFKAYLHYSGNSIGKLKTFISEFRDDKSFLKNSAKLKALKINKLP